jgi:hypothetical protein
LIAVAVVFSLVVAAFAGAARSPRLETLDYRAADTKLAQKAVVRMSDLATGWKGGSTTTSNDDPPNCPWQDYSKFTITGEAGTEFSQGVASVLSQVEVFETKAHALGDFQVDTNPGTAKCLGRALAKSIGGGTTLVSAQSVTPPKVGERATALRLVFKSGSSKIYLDVIAFVRGRAVAAVAAFNVGRALRDVDALARAMDLRLQPNVA